MAYGSETGCAVSGTETVGEALRASPVEGVEEQDAFVRHEKELRTLVSELILCSEREKRRMAENIHDNMLQPLFFLNIRLDLLKKSNSEAHLVNSFDEMQQVICELMEMMRNFTFELTWPLLHEVGLEGAIEDWLVREIEGKNGVDAIFEDDGREKRLDDETRAFLFRSVRELVVNAVKHADAERLKVSVAKREGNVVVGVEDDGSGFDVQRCGRRDEGGFHFGLLSIAEQVECLGGSMKIESEAGLGTTVIISVPAKQQFGG